MVLNGGVLEINENMELELLILTNSSLDNISLDNVVRNYLTNWPNLKEKLQDFSRKVEFFAAKKEPGALSLEQELRFDLESVKNVDSLFCASLKFLDLYLRRHFFPAGYEDKDFAWTKEHFYALKLVLKQQTSYFSATFCPPKEYLFHTELNYLCCRLNEAGITFQDGKKLWFFVQSTR
jgi:hypothetical protein